MNVRSSRLATDLEAAANAAKDPFEAACLRADLAAQWARLGRVEEADLLLSSLRERFKTAPHPRLTPWLNYAESMIDLQRNRVPEARMKMRRAHALAVAANVTPLASMAAGILAHMHWNEQEVEIAVHLIRESLAGAPKQDCRARCGTSLLLGEMLCISGYEEAGKAWFVKCRRYASVTGDTASMSALNFNLAVVALAILRQRKYELLDDSQLGAKAQTQWTASSTLDEIFKISVDEGMSLLQTAQLHSLTDEPALALVAYSNLETKNLASAVRQQSVWSADQAWCELRIGNIQGALAKASSAMADLDAVVHVDDLALTHSSLALVFQSVGQTDKCAFHREQASKYWGEYRAVQRKTADLCLEIAEDQ